VLRTPMLFECSSHPYTNTSKSCLTATALVTMNILPSSVTADSCYASVTATRKRSNASKHVTNKDTGLCTISDIRKYILV
jgi:hypothetical protein